MTQPILEIKHLKKSYGQNEVLKDISLTVHKGEVISIIGSSGSGKSTFLRSINLLETPTEGEILYRGENVLEKGYNLTHYREKLGMVFQSFNLFENLNVLENTIVAQTTVLKRDHSEAEKIAKENLEKVGMGERYWQAKPKQLSGGQKQRVAIARALSMNPDAILFDEPTSALDPEMVPAMSLTVSSLWIRASLLKKASQKTSSRTLKKNGRTSFFSAISNKIKDCILYAVFFSN